MSPQDRPPTVVIASRLFLPEPGAASLRLAALARALLDSGSAVEVLTTTAPTGSDDAGIDGIRVRRWPALRNREGYIRGYLGYISFDVPLFVRLLTCRAPDVVICEPPPTTGVVVRLACRIRRVPYIYYAADLWSEAVREVGVTGLVQRVLSAVERCALAGAAEILTISPAMVDRLSALGVRTPISMVGHGADTSVFHPDGPAAPGPPYLVYAGTASEVHGARIFTQALARVITQVPDARVVFIGQGTERVVMEDDARNLPAGTVTFLPRIDPSETACWLRGARAALASVRPGPYAFAIATKVYAAAGCGTPVLHVGPGPGRDLVADNDLGWTVDYDVDQVADAMVAALRTAPDPTSARRRSTWTAQRASLHAAARRAADCVERVTARARATAQVRSRWGVARREEVRR